MVSSQYRTQWKQPAIAAEKYMQVGFPSVSLLTNL
jgi:hypothetical protein